MTSFLPRAMRADIALVVPVGWTLEPPAQSLALAAAERVRIGFRVQIPASYVFRYPRVALAADVVFDGGHLGQVTEAMVECAVDG